MGNSEHPILTEILSSIDQRGKCEVPLSRLKTSVFKQKNKDDWVEKWCHDLKHKQGTASRFLKEVEAQRVFWSLAKEKIA